LEKSVCELPQHASSLDEYQYSESNPIPVKNRTCDDGNDRGIVPASDVPGFRKRIREKSSPFWADLKLIA